MNKKYKRRLIVPCMVAIVAALVGVQALVFAFGQEDIQDQLESSAKGIAVSIAQMMALDAEDYRAFLQTKDAGSAYYRKMQTRLASVRKESDAIRYIYTERRLDAKTTEFILDAEPIGSTHYSPPGSQDPNNLQKEKAFTSNEAVGRRSSGGDKWGRLISAYAPIVDESGEILGLVGVDMDGWHLYRQFWRINRAMTMASLAIIALSLVSLWGFSDTILDCLLKDKLTGAFAKRHFESLLEGEMLRSAKRGVDLSLMMLDLDHFKTVNDKYGHVFGDRVLASVSRVIRGLIRPSDHFVRYGGDEFAIIMAGVGPEGAKDVAERLRCAIEAAPVFNEDVCVPVQMTVTVGVAVQANLSQSARDLVENADSALYEAKKKRNAVSLFDAATCGHDLARRSADLALGARFSAAGWRQGHQGH